ncbi:hypothetical protein BSZ36_17590 [Rubricoccus marinus]|uniref:Uncharacterized protein n=1 Tax=Rubricoccus marinus TaxID=716817 RepID=A0A259TV38_9BACT|nr:hypothetical protein BSZ36_17590 [Rubricoccus marinus]
MAAAAALKRRVVARAPHPVGVSSVRLVPVRAPRPVPSPLRLVLGGRPALDVWAATVPTPALVQRGVFPVWHDVRPGTQRRGVLRWRRGGGGGREAAGTVGLQPASVRRA